MKRWDLIIWVLCACGGCWGEPKASVGADITAFEFPDQPGAAEWYNGFIHSFFTNRIDIGPTVFPREYLAISDAWLTDVQRDGIPIQQVMRKALLDQQMNAEGYVLTQQHGASSHDEGWPFPHWIQVPGTNGSVGVTAGWHFYDHPQGWEILYKQSRKKRPNLFGEAAIKTWGVEGLESVGLNDELSAWELKSTGGFPLLTSPAGVSLDAFNCPFIQIRWNQRGGEAFRPYMEWQRVGDADWSADRRTYFYPEWRDQYSKNTGMFHSILPLHRHPDWKGKIARIRFCMSANDQPPETFFIRSIFTHWDTRHLVNNAIHIKAAFEYFRWTGDLGFLREMMPNLRVAMRYMMNEGHGLELNHIRCTWHGHDGRPGYIVHADGTKTWQPGHGKGGNYWDLLPLGWNDMYTTTHYYAALLAMAQLEEAIRQQPGWDMPQGFLQLDPAFLRRHAGDVKVKTNDLFFDEKAGRFVGCIDADGVAHDYGFTFINLEAIHYGIASEKHAQQIMAWIDGERVVKGDTSTGEDLYAYRLAPRATTRRNVEWYAHAWRSPEANPFGGQVQDGGAVLGFSFYDLMSRIKILGADNAWKRLMEIRAWDEEVAAYGGYRKYYNEGQGGTTLQGGGTAGGVGIDFEFTESSMLAAVVPLGFMGLRPDGQVLNIEPHLPKACPKMTVRNLHYQGLKMDVVVEAQCAHVLIHNTPAAPLIICFGQQKKVISRAGHYTFERAP